MKVLLALNSFKGSCLSLDANRAFAEGLKSHFPSRDLTICPLCDGGDGSIEALYFHLKIKKISVRTQDVMGATILSDYLFDKANKTAYIELASTSGIARIDVKNNDILRNNTYGTGLLIRDALARKAQKIILLTGGSATNDAGLGILAAIGIKIRDKNRKLLLPIPANLIHIKEIDDRIVHTFKEISFEVWTDVTNPFTGPKGAVAVYSEQKGALKKEQKILEKGMMHLRDLITTKYNLDLDHVSGSGSAGGVSGGLAAILGATIVHGTNAILSLTQFEQKLASHDIVFTGEGRLDDQSGYGKLVHGVTSLAARYDKPVIGICGKCELDRAQIADLGFAGVYSIVPGPVTIDDAMTNWKGYLRNLGYSLGATLKALRP